MIKEFTMQTLDSLAIKVLLDRLERLRPETRALWGKMNVHQMVCHLNLRGPVTRYALLGTGAAAE